MKHEDAARLMGAYLDGELDLSTSLELEEHLAECPECQEKMEGEQEVVEAIREEMPRYEASPFLKTRIRAALREESGTAEEGGWRGILPRWVFLCAGICVAVLVAAVAFWPARVPDVVRDAVADHVRSLQVNHLMDVASTDQHTVKPWFAGKLDYSPQVVDLSAEGYPLIGGRLDVLDNRTVAAIIYQRHKHSINLFIWPAGGSGVPGRLLAVNGYHVLGWTKAGMRYLAVSELGEGEFRDFVKLIEDKTVEVR